MRREAGVLMHVWGSGGNESRDKQRVGQVFRIWGLALFLFLAS